MEPETIRIISHGITLTAEPFRTITKIDHEITIGIETTTIRTDSETIRQLPRRNNADPPGIDNIETSELQ